MKIYDRGLHMRELALPTFAEACSAAVVADSIPPMRPLRPIWLLAWMAAGVLWAISRIT